jgi:hypothetical protein
MSDSSSFQAAVGEMIEGAEVAATSKVIWICDRGDGRHLWVRSFELPEKIVEREGLVRFYAWGFEWSLAKTPREVERILGRQLEEASQKALHICRSGLCEWSEVRTALDGEFISHLMIRKTPKDE